MEFSLQNFRYKVVHPDADIVENGSVDRIRRDRVPRGAKQQIAAFYSNAVVRAKRTHGQVCVNRNLKRLFQESCRRSGCSRVFEVVDTNGVDTITGTMYSNVIGFARQ